MKPWVEWRSHEPCKGDTGWEQFYSALTGLVKFLREVPGLAPWALLCRACGALESGNGSILRANAESKLEKCLMRKASLKQITITMAALVVFCAAFLPAQTAKAPELKGKTVNINKASEADLVKNVPLITPDLAKKIVKYRKDNGDFQTLDELLQIDGFNRNLLKRIKTFLLLEGIGGKDCTC
jgi:competence protein ComEA